jgi:Acetyltransferase (GNAT) domain
MVMLTPSASGFSNDTWLRAVLAHVPKVSNFPVAGNSEIFRLLAAKRNLVPLAHLQSCTTALTPCPLPSVTAVPTVPHAKSFLRHIGMPLVLRGAPMDHPVMAALLKAASHSKILKSWERAVLDVSGTFDAWMQENFDHKRRKELKRLKARLSEQGQLTVDALQPAEHLAPHLSAFLAIESSGWKGKRGTAIESDPRATEGLTAGLTAMHKKGKVRFWTMRLNGKPVASLFALVDGGEAVLGKIGHDESFAKYSPGVLLVIAATQCLFDDPTIHFADSNAIPGHPMIDRIWRDRMACMDIVIAGPTVSAFTFQTVALFHGLKDAAHAAFKQAYLHFTGRKKS